MRILVLTDYFHPEQSGGVEWVIFETGRRLVQRGHSVLVLTLGKTSACRESLHGISVWRVPSYDLTPLLRLQSRISLLFVSEVLKAVSLFKPDIIHLHNPFFFSCALCTPLLHFVVKRPLVVTLHLGSMDNFGGVARICISMYERLWARLCFPLCARIICVSRSVAVHALSLGAREERLSIVPNGVDLERFYPGKECVDNGSLVVTFIGRLIFNKGPHILVKAIPKILASLPNVKFLIVGDGIERKNLENDVRRLGVDSFVLFLGIVNDVGQILRESHIFVRPSLSEGMPLTVLEAMACGLAVVATSVGGTPELIHHGVTGILIPPGSVEALADAVVQLGRDKLLRQRLGENARNYVSRFYTWERVADDIERIYYELLDIRL